MSTKKHDLTSQADHITGSAGSDYFIGTKGELGSDDVLNGGGGIDTITAMVSGKDLGPVMKNIEKGVFTHHGNNKLGLDLANADKMTSVTLKGLHADAVIRNAASLNTFALSNVDQHDVTIRGVDLGLSLLQKLSFNNVQVSSIDFQTIGSLQPHTLDVSMKGSDFDLMGDISAVELAVHSNGKSSNGFSFHADSALESIQKVTIDGTADLGFNISQTTAFRSMTIFDASGLEGNLSTQLESDELTSLIGGSGNDSFSIDDMGGTVGQRATGNAGAGNDRLAFSGGVFDGTKMVFNGGNGWDVVGYLGADKGIVAGFDKFEVLELQAISGTYTLDDDWKVLRLYSQTESADQVRISGGTGLKLVQGSSDADYINVTDLGGKAGHKAHVNLNGGNDTINVSELALNAATQRIDGGLGHDGFVISGHFLDVGELFKHFEYTYMYNMSGTYNFQGSGVDGIVFGGAAQGAMTINGLESGSSIQIMSTQTVITSVNINGAEGSQVDEFTIDLIGNADFGSATFGLLTPHLSVLNIASRENAHTMYISDVGDAADMETLNISGDKKLTLIASNASTCFIDKITITNSAGADILGLIDGGKALSANGVVIDGGSGSDALVGGAGTDTISGGGGDDSIHGSLGVDTFNLLGGGQDMLIFHSIDQSAYNSGDNVIGFNIFNGIDISDLVSSASFSGNVATMGAGLATLSTNHTVGFFDTASHTLYVDINHDGSLDAAHDMEFHLTGLDSFTGSSLIG